jgi:hypothetical protein
MVRPQILLQILLSGLCRPATQPIVTNRYLQIESRAPLRAEALGPTLMRKFTMNHEPAGDGCDLICVRDKHQMRAKLLTSVASHSSKHRLRDRPRRS